MKPHRVVLSPALNDWLLLAKDSPWLRDRFKKARKAIQLMREIGPTHPGFHTHKMVHLQGPGGRDIWNSYVENRTPGAWRMYWIYRDNGDVYILSMGPHDHTPGSQPAITRKGSTRQR